MKYVKTLGLTAIAAVAVLAFVGASSASATVLCAEAVESGCESPWPATSVSGETAKAELVSNLGTVECASTAKGKTTAESGEPLPGLIEELKFSGCHLGLVGCTATAVHTPYHAALTHTSGTNGTMKVTKEGTNGAPGATVICSGLIECTFTAEGIELEALGGAPGHLVAKEAPLGFAGGKICPEKAKWNANYTVTEPNPVFVSAN